MKRIGIDIGSTTAKVVAIDNDNNILSSLYKRHNAKAKDVVIEALCELEKSIGDEDISIRLTGSIGMGFAEMCHLPFVQEVVAAKKAIQKDYPQVSAMIDIGGEDAKVVLFHNGNATDLRMNGNCAGGTGAFIDQMAIILGITVDELGELALKSDQIYPIASRCGVFCKTDVQNLIAKNVSRENIAASIFHAVAVQTIVTLAHGADIGKPLLFCGGPLTFLPALRKAFKDYLQLNDNDIIIPANGNLLPAIGSAISDIDDDKPMKLSEAVEKINKGFDFHGARHSGLAPIFKSKEDFELWNKRMSSNKVQTSELQSGKQNVYLGIDSGSTTTKIVVTDEQMRIVYSFYCVNGGNPIKAVENGLNGLKAECEKHNTELNILGSCSTGYGEDLIKTAFSLQGSIIETIAHYMAARYLNKDVSFILDIGGQDMKAIFVNEGVIDRIEINESCSSGCGSFISAFAESLGYTVQGFAESACTSQAPCDLGTRCTVFMNSRVKQVLREGATINDIAAGLAYSVVKNCIYKVLKLKNASALGKNIVVQGGTMRNDAVVRALEELTGADVTRCNVPELMGAFGCALYAKQMRNKEMRMKDDKNIKNSSLSTLHSSLNLDDIISKAHYESRTLNCHGCENNCLVARYKFDNGKCYYSGNRCERIFTNGDRGKRIGVNIYEKKYHLLFDRNTTETSTNVQRSTFNVQHSTFNVQRSTLTVGIPRMLNIFEDYPFWHTMFTECGIDVILSGDSKFLSYEHNARMVMSDNICFPAKLVHSHVQELIDRHVDRIFMPFVVFERGGNGQNSYNCPVVTGYPEVVKSVQNEGVPIDAPTINFKDKDLLLKQLYEYFGTLGIDRHTIKTATDKAWQSQSDYEHELVKMNEDILQAKTDKHSFTIMLAGRPYHADPLIQHNVARMLSEMGIDVITDDIVRDKDVDVSDVHFISQWTYPNRILKAAKWCALQGQEMQFVEMTSFGCGPDAFLVDEVRDLLLRYGKALTLLKLDDINNIGSMKLRVRSLVESMKLAAEERQGKRSIKPFVDVPPFDESQRNRKILAPYFTPFLSPLIPAVIGLAGYDCENLPMSDAQSSEYGLKYANNEVCYPATLIVGDMIKAFRSGRYNP
jgi:predicted CoA-substrate-specific enzyme activase